MTWWWQIKLRFRDLEFFSVLEFVFRIGTKHSLLKDSQIPDAAEHHLCSVCYGWAVGMQSSEFSLAAAACLSPHHLTHGDNLGLFNSSCSREDVVSACTEAEPVNQTNHFQEWCYFSHHPLQEMLTDMLPTKPWLVRSQNCRFMVKKYSPRQSLHPFWTQEYSH